MRNPGLERFAVKQTPGQQSAEDFLNSDEYWNRVEQHPDYSPHIDPSALTTVPYETGYQGYDQAAWHPGLEAEDERGIESERARRQRRQPLTQQFSDDEREPFEYARETTLPPGRSQTPRGSGPRGRREYRDAPNWVGQDEHDALQRAGFRYVPEGGATSGNFYYRDHQHNPTEGYHISPPNQSRPYWRAEHGPAAHNGRNSQGLSIGMSGDVNSVIASAETHERRSRAMRAHMPDSDLVHGVPADTYSLALAQDRMANRTDYRRTTSPDQFNHWQQGLRHAIRQIDASEGRERHPNPYEANRREDNIINLTSHGFPQVSPVDTYDAFNNDHWRYDPIGHSADEPGPMFKKRVNGVDHAIWPTHLGDWSYTAHRPDGSHWSATLPSHQEARDYAEDMMRRLHPDPIHGYEGSTKTPGQKMPMPGGEGDNWLDEMLDESLATGRHPEHRNEVAYHGRDDLSGLDDEYEHRENEGGYYPQPSRHVPRDGHATICADCAAYHANGEGDPEHQHRYEHGMQAAMATLHHPSNLTFNDNDDEGNRIKPEDDQCFICGQQVDPDTETFHSPYGAPGFNMHVFRPGERGYTPPNPPRTAATNPGLNVKRQKSQVPKHRNLQSVDTAQGEANEAASHRGHLGQHRTPGIKTIKRRRAPKGQVAYVQGGDLGSVASLITEDSLTYVTNAQMGYPELGIPPASGMQAQQNSLAELQRDRMQNPQPGAPMAMPAGSVDAVRPNGVGAPQVPGNMSGRTAGVREGMEAQGWTAHESPEGSGSVSHYTKPASDGNTHVLIKDHDGWTHVVGVGEPNEWGEYETHAQNPISYGSLRDALMAVNNVQSVPMRAYDTRPDAQKYSNMDSTRILNDVHSGDQPQTLWRPYTDSIDGKYKTQQEDVEEGPPMANGFSVPPVSSENGADSEMSDGARGYWKRQKRASLMQALASWKSTSSISDLPEYGVEDWPREHELAPSIKRQRFWGGSQPNDIERITDPEFNSQHFPPQEEYRYPGEFMSFKPGGESGPSEDVYDDADWEVPMYQTGHQEPFIPLVKRHSAWGADDIRQDAPGHRRTLEWHEYPYEDMEDSLESADVPGTVDYHGTNHMPEGMVAWKYFPDEHLDGPVGRYGDRWPEISEWRPTKENETTGVVQPMIDPGSRRNSLSGPGHILDSFKDAMDWAPTHHEDPFFSPQRSPSKRGRAGE